MAEVKWRIEKSHSRGLYNRSTSRMDLDKKIIRTRKHFLCGMYISRKLSPSFAPIALSHGFVHLQGAVVVVTDAVDGL